MGNFFIKYKNIVVYVYRTNKLSVNWLYEIIYVSDDIDAELTRRKYPYANSIKIDLQEQIFGKNLKRTLPKKIKEIVYNIEEIKSIIRDDKIERILNQSSVY